MGLLSVKKSRKRGVHASHRSGLISRIKETVWPSMGWKAVLRLTMLKLKRDAESPHKVAFGVALGVGVSFLPLPVIGIVMALLVGWALGASLAAVLIGQVVGNPWTFPLIWWSTYGLGTAIWPGVDPHFSWKSIHWKHFMNHLPDILNNLVIPLLLGGAIIGGVLGALTYVVVYREVWRFGKKRSKARAKRKHG